MYMYVWTIDLILHLLWKKELNWNVTFCFKGELQILAHRLDGPFNIEMVVSPLGVKISEAIMVFQENSGSFSSKVGNAHGMQQRAELWAYMSIKIASVYHLLSFDT